jgi:hypothetical protein
MSNANLVDDGQLTSATPSASSQFHYRRRLTFADVVDLLATAAEIVAAASRSQKCKCAFTRTICVRRASYVARVSCKCCAHLPCEVRATRDITFWPLCISPNHSPYSVLVRIYDVKLKCVESVQQPFKINALGIIPYHIKDRDFSKIGAPCDEPRHIGTVRWQANNGLTDLHEPVASGITKISLLIGLPRAITAFVLLSCWHDRQEKLGLTDIWFLTEYSVCQ